MPEQNELIAELKGQRETIQEQLDGARTQISELQARVAELEPLAATVQSIREIVLPSGEGNVVQTIREMHTAFAEVKRIQLQEQINTAVTAALGDIAQNERGAQLIREMVGPVESAEAATARVKELLEKDYVQSMLKAVVSEMAGFSAIITGQDNKNTDWRQAIADKAEENARGLGLTG